MQRNVYSALSLFFNVRFYCLQHIETKQFDASLRQMAVIGIIDNAVPCRITKMYKVQTYLI